MKEQQNSVHWLAKVAVFCTFWFLLWLTLSVMLLLELITTPAGGEDNGFYFVLLVIFGAFTAWTAYKGRKRVKLLGHGQRVKVSLSSEVYEVTSSTPDVVSSRNKRYHYQFKVNGKTYKNTLYSKPFLKEAIEVVYDPNNPDINEPLFSLAVYFDAEKKTWYANIGRMLLRVVLVVALFVIIAIWS